MRWPFSCLIEEKTKGNKTKNVYLFLFDYVKSRGKKNIHLNWKKYPWVKIRYDNLDLKK